MVKQKQSVNCDLAMLMQLVDTGDDRVIWLSTKWPKLCFGVSQTRRSREEHAKA
jgi:hypothetical protein